MEPCKIRGTTQPLVSRTGARRQGNIFSFRSREKNVLDFSSYRSGFINSHAEKDLEERAPRRYQDQPTSGMIPHSFSSHSGT